MTLAITNELLSSCEIKTVIIRTKTEINFALSFYDYIKNLVTPVYYALACKHSQEPKYKTIFKDCLEDIFMYVLGDEERTYVNFNSYIRKRFEFYFLNYLRKLKAEYEKNVTLDDECISSKYSYELSELSSYRYQDEKFNAVKKYLKQFPHEFTYSHVSMLTMFCAGYTINEIANYFGCSFGKVKAELDRLLNFLKHNYFGIH